MATFGEVLKKKRTEKGYSQAQIARAIDVNPGIISQWENGKCILRDKTKGQMLAEYLDVSVNELFYGKEPEILQPYKLEQVPKEPEVAQESVKLKFVKSTPLPSRPSLSPEGKALLEGSGINKPNDGLVYRAEDKRDLDNINKIIMNLRYTQMERNEKYAAHKTLCKFREQLERKVMFGE